MYKYHICVHICVYMYIQRENTFTVYRVYILYIYSLYTKREQFFSLLKNNKTIGKYANQWYSSQYFHKQSKFNVASTQIEK